MTPESTRDAALGQQEIEPAEELEDGYDPVDEAGWESFPASDPPAWSEAARNKR